MTPRRRWLGWGLIVYGVLGIALVMSCGGIGLGVAARIERLAAAADGTLDAAARSTRAAADSFTNVDGSLAEAGTSSVQAADLAREASTSLDALAGAMELSVFGAQPLLPLAARFRDSADQAMALGETLDGVSTSLEATRTDVSGIGIELESLADELETLQGAADPGDGRLLRLFVVLLLAWIAVPALGGLLLGLSLLRRPVPDASVT
jgi:hypothetical protein